MKFLWLDINASYSHSSLALPALHAQLGEKILEKSKWHAVQGTIKTDKTHIISQINEISPDYIFATGWLFNINYLLEILAKTDAMNEYRGIFLGGPEFLGENETFLRTNRFVTAVFKGEGEEIFPSFIQSLMAEKESVMQNYWREIPGFEYIGSGEYIKSEVQTVKEFCKLVPPENSSFFNWEKAFVQLETSRGCFNNCRFCVSGIEKTPVQNLPGDIVRTRLNNIKSHGIKEVRILDRTFNANPSRAVEMLDIFSEFAGDIQFHIEVHPALLSPLFKKRLQNLPDNLLHLEAGIQSMQENVITECNRSGKAKEAREGLKYLLSVKKFQVHADLIAGLPGYTFNNLIGDTLSLMETAPHEIQLESLKLLPGTYFRNNAGKYGIRYSPLPPYEILSTPSATFADIGKAMTLSRIIDYWYNDSRWRTVFSGIFCTNRRLLCEFIGELHNTEYITQPLSFESKSLLLYDFVKNHSPEHLFGVSLQWIRNGLSVKKEPAKILTAWNRHVPQHKNPLFDPLNIRVKYYYAVDNNTIYWFSYNNETDRNKPAKESEAVLTL